MDQPTVATMPAEPDLHNGLSSAEVTASRDEYGSNAFSPLPTKSVWDFYRENFADPMLKILLACAAVSLALGAFTGHWIDGVAISVAVIVVTSVGTYNQVRAQGDYTALDALSSRERVRVIRDGAVVEIDGDELVRGDLLEINTGDVVPADCLYVRGSDLLVNEAAITGEPDTTKVEGDELFGSSRILDGSGRAVISGVGDATVFGKVRQEIGARDKTTPLQERLEVLAGKIGKFGTYAAVLTFSALVISGLVRGEASVDGETVAIEFGFDTDFAEFLLEALTIAITIIVVAVPEGLPLAVTLSLAYTTRKMAQDKALVRELAACETMGAATIVCSDKTGTLTSGAMTLSSLDVGGHVWETESLDQVTDDPDNQATFEALAEGIAINSTADLVERDGELAVAGNSTEGALLRWLNDHAYPYQRHREEAVVVRRREFNSARKHMLTAVDLQDGNWRVFAKGAPEIVLDMCSHASTEDGIAPLDDTKRAAIVNTVRDHATRGNRTLGFAVRDLPAGTPEDEIDTGMTFSGLFVIADPIRPEVHDAVERCRRAGVRVMIITGDIFETAREIGRQAGILTEGELVLTGEEFRGMDDATVTSNLDRIAVLSRALPDDKKRMVELLQANGEVVSVTGDGVNDAPALVTADVGFSMGSGSKVAREASDIIIVDDNFASLVRAIRWGRSVFENIRKFLQFQLTVNVVALATAFIAAFFGYGTPLTAVQLLWVNLIMDSLAALALALEPPTDQLFDQPPHGRDEPLISRSMWISVFSIGAFMLGVLLVILSTDLLIDTTDDEYRYTFLFNAFVWMQIWNELNSRSTRFNRSPFKGVFSSPSFLGVMAAIIALQVLIIEFGGEVFSSTGLDIGDWVKSILIGSTVLGVSALVRLVGGRLVAPAPALAR
ncbi:MAG: calcium-translocating P-type ATPase, PMCA-type [Acidimicrobiia bacterium]